MKTKSVNFLRVFFILAILALFCNYENYAQDNKMTDPEITNTVSNQLFMNPTTPSYLIDVSTSEGIVLLEGSIDNILAKERATQIASAVKGVKGVVNKIEVDAPYRPDQSLKKDIEDELFNDPATDSYELNVKVNDGKVTLSGTVQSWQEKQLAAYVTKGVRGVKELNNNIDVNYKLERNDYEIQNEVAALLENDVRVDDALIDVEVTDGEVELSGTVGSLAEKMQAESDAWVAGVKAVEVDDLEVKTWARDDDMRKNKYVYKTDSKIKEAVEDAFLYDPRVLSFNPEVSVDNGVVTLTGSVDNLKAKKAAEQDAKNVVGVFSVKNYLKVRPVFVPGDDDLETDVESALIGDPYIEKFEINVNADNGIVELNGEVDSYFEKVQAEDVASTVKGVIAVDNNLEIDQEYDPYPYNYYGWNTYFPNTYYEPDDEYESDWEILNDIQNELWWSPYVNQDDIDVSVVNGKAILDGKVETEREKLFAEINAIEGGANTVENNIEVDFTPED